MNWVLFFLVLLSLPLVIAHGGVDHETQEEALDHIDEVGYYPSLNPLYYWQQDQKGAAVLAVLLWFGTGVMLLVLAFPILARLFDFSSD